MLILIRITLRDPVCPSPLLVLVDTNYGVLVSKLKQLKKLRCYDKGMLFVQKKKNIHCAF